MKTGIFIGKRKANELFNCFTFFNKVNFRNIIEI